MMNFGFLVFVIVCIQPNARAQNSKGRSCSAILAKDSSASSGTYTIDPDGLGRGEEYEVYCDMSRNGGVTVIGHDSENRTHVANFNRPGSYRRIVNYSSTSLPQIIRLRSISIECTQYIEYDCKHSRLKEFAWWLNPDGDARTYWGTGSRRGDDICACSLTSNCPRADLTCNCDANDHIWREDKGTLSFKADLPVVELRFGDTENNPPDIEEAYHILGPLECFGQQDIDDCDTNPCENGGVCVDRENDFECICNAGYGNVLCQTDLDDCDPNPCVNGGNCTDKLDDFECECPPEFEGKMCQSAIVSDGECGSYCLLIILLSICIAIGVGSVAVIIAIAFIAS